MKLVRFGESGREKPGLLDSDGAVRDLSGEVADIDGAALAPETMTRLAALSPQDLPRVADGVRLGPCVGGIGKIICIGLNYADHAAETGQTPPPEPVIFMKATSAVCGPFDPIFIPRGSEKTDWEVELAFIIGKRAKYVEESDAMDHVAGYAVLNDVTERAFQNERSGQWTKGKSCDHFAPLGPFLASRDEIADPQNLGMRLDVNGRRMQNGSTSTMIYGVRTLISYLSGFMTLHPGDVISTGTPPGVGMARTPQVFLRPGDVVDLAIDGLGAQRQQAIADPN